jgi:23S rRNA (cytosine1962-C5)-methyltransferase
VGARAAGKEVLNVFAYSGAFSLYAARGGASYILSVDLSAPALAAARHNFALNQDVDAVAAAQHETMEADAFAALPALARAGRRFTMIVVDPPTFARSKEDVPGARQAYRTLTRGALDLLAPGGTLVMASCTGRIDAASFFALIAGEAATYGRPLQAIKHTGHPLDHPITFPEGAYLKCLFAIAP